MPKLTSLSPAAAGILVAGALVGVAVFGGSGGGGSCGTGGATSKTAVSAQQNSDLNTAIKTVSTTKNGVVDNQLALSLHYGAQIESSGNPDAVGAGSVGVFQIQLDAHPEVSETEARNITFSVNYMVPIYRKALAQFNRENPASVWQENPQYAANQVAYMAERPLVNYTANRGDAVPRAYRQAVMNLKQSGISTDFSGGSAGSSATLVSVQEGGCKAPDQNGTELLVSADGSNAALRQKSLTALNGTIGTPYAWAGGNANGPTRGVCVGGAAANDCNIVGYDCSGLVLYALGQAGIRSGLDHLAEQQYRATRGFTTATSLDSLGKAQPGDLVFFTGSDGSRSAPGHVGIYIGNGRMINAPQSGELVQIAEIAHNPYWRSTFVAMTDPYAWAASLKKA